jgi:DNA-binding response OmpR family regulator
MERKKPITILLVEDDSATRDLITIVIERKTEYSLIIAENGEEALEIFHEHRPDVMLLDILLPYLNGLELLRQLKESDQLKDTIVIMISALGYHEVIQKAITSGAKDFVVKPFDVEFLLSRIHKYLEAQFGQTDRTDNLLVSSRQVKTLDR